MAFVLLRTSRALGLHYWNTTAQRISSSHFATSSHLAQTASERWNEKRMHRYNTDPEFRRKEREHMAAYHQRRDDGPWRLRKITNMNKKRSDPVFRRYWRLGVWVHRFKWARGEVEWKVCQPTAFQDKFETRCAACGILKNRRLWWRHKTISERYECTDCYGKRDWEAEVVPVGLESHDWVTKAPSRQEYLQGISSLTPDARQARETSAP